MTVRVWHRFSPSLFLQTICLVVTCHLSVPFLGSFTLPGKKMRQYIASSSLGKTYSYRSASETAPTPALPSAVSVERSILDRYSLDNLTSAFNSVCPYLCFVSWLLIKWRPPGPDLQWKDSMVIWTTDSSTCKPGNWPITSSSLTPCDFCVSTGQGFPEYFKQRSFCF